MKRKRFSLRSLIWSSVQVAIGALLLFQVAYWRLGGAFPETAAENGDVNATIGARADRTLPATYTPFPSSTPLAGVANLLGTPAATSTLPPAAVIPIADLPPTITATPFKPPDYLLQYVEVRYVEQPPVAVDCDGKGFVFTSRFPSKVGGAWPYHAYLPPCYGHDGRVYPVLYLLHGSGHTDAQWVELGLPQHMNQGLMEKRYPPFIVIMPAGGTLNDTTSGGTRSVEGVVIENLIPWVDANFCTWNSREGRSIGGLSRGGYWALMMAFRHPELFGAVAGHSSQLRLDVDPPQYNPLATYSSADLSNMRIWMDWGEHDFLRPGQKRLHAALMNAGIPHTAQVFPGGHANYYWYAHVREYLDWHAESWPLERDVYPVCER